MDEIELYAWIGEDEFGSGTVGLKQAMVPSGLIPMVATSKDKMDQEYIREQLQQQADIFGKTIRLCRFKLVEEVVTLEPCDHEVPEV